MEVVASCALEASVIVPPRSAPAEGLVTEALSGAVLSIVFAESCCVVVFPVVSVKTTWTSYAPSEIPVVIHGVVHGAVASVPITLYAPLPPTGRYCHVIDAMSGSLGDAERWAVRLGMLPGSTPEPDGPVVSMTTLADLVASTFPAAPFER